jgi:hypothetical protein
VVAAVRRDPNSWRYGLHPADPEYSEPPAQAEEDDESPADDYDDTDPRNHGPMHYTPPSER